MSIDFFRLSNWRHSHLRGRVIVALLAFAASLCFASEAHGCSCLSFYASSQPCGAYVSADVVFAGTATEIAPMSPVPGSDGKSFTTSGRVVRFTVEAAFRGVSGDTIETHEAGSSCDFHFNQGERYFVYGSRRSTDGTIYVHSCSSTKTLDRAAADLAYAQGMARGEPTPSIVGYVAREARADASMYRTWQPLEGIKILIEGGAAPIEVRTDAEGTFRVFGLAMGAYRVRALTPPELRWVRSNEAVEVRVGGGRCQGAEFLVTTLSRISGQLLNSEGVAAAQTRVNLVAVDEHNKEISAAGTLTETHTDAEGRYKFDGVAPGRYLVAVNARNQPGRSDPPYPRSYYPGVRDAARATVISVGDNEQHVNHEFRLPPPLKERTIEGVVLMPDGSPVPHALLTLEFTEREWIETETADAHGRFKLKVYDGFTYLLAGERRWEEGGVWRGIHSPPVEFVSGAADAAPIKLIVSEDGIYRFRYAQRKQRKP
jgi:hypothetical protein